MVSIKLAFKQVIDQSSSGAFEQCVLNASYNEFLLKSQAYNMDGKCKTFTELKARDGRANSLHYKLSFAVGHFIEKLDNIIPALTDNQGNTVKFEVPQFELIESDVLDKSAHKVAVNYITPELVLCNTIGDYLILAKQQSAAGQPFETFMLKLQPNLSIVSYTEKNQAVHYNNMSLHSN